MRARSDVTRLKGAHVEIYKILISCHPGTGVDYKMIAKFILGTELVGYSKTNEFRSVIINHPPIRGLALILEQRCHMHSRLDPLDEHSLGDRRRIRAMRHKLKERNRRPFDCPFRCNKGGRCTS